MKLTDFKVTSPSEKEEIVTGKEKTMLENLIKDFESQIKSAKANPQTGEYELKSYTEADKEIEPKIIQIYMNAGWNVVHCSVEKFNGGYNTIDTVTTLVLSSKVKEDLTKLQISNAEYILSEDLLTGKIEPKKDIVIVHIKFSSNKGRYDDVKRKMKNFGYQFNSSEFTGQNNMDTNYMFTI